MYVQNGDTESVNTFWIVSNPNANWEYHKCKEISSIIMTVVLLKKVLIGKRSIVIAKFPQEAKVIGEDVK